MGNEYMQKIFTDNLPALIYSASGQIWYDIMTYIKVYVSENYQTPKDNLEDYCYLLDKSGRICRDEVVDTFKEAPKKVIKENPCGIFLYYGMDDAKQIQEHYGVICQGEKNINPAPLTKICDYELELDGKEESIQDVLKTILGDINEMPSNSLFVIDKYLFNDKKKKEKVKNFISILLEKVIWGEHKSTYYVGFLCNYRDKANAQEVVESVLKNIQKSCDIIVEIFCTNDLSSDKAFHNRCILSNYFVITTDHKLLGGVPETYRISPLFLRIEEQKHKERKYSEKSYKCYRLKTDMNKLREYTENKKKFLGKGETVPDEIVRIERAVGGVPTIESDVSFDNIKHPFLK